MYILKRCCTVTYQHFIHDDPQAPPVTELVVTVLHEDLGGDVVGGPAEGLGGDSVQHVLLTHAEVGDLDVALSVQHHVVQLQVPGRGRERERGAKPPRGGRR